MKLLLFRILPWLLLPGLLSGCAAYDHLAHPHRLGNPPMTASAKAKYKAAEKARHKGLTLGTSDAKPKAADGEDGAKASASGDAPSADAASPEPAATKAAPEAKEAGKGLPDNVRNTYDKNGHLKRSMLQRMEASNRQRHHYDLSFRGHTDMARDARKHRKITKGKGKEKGVSGKGRDEAADATPEPEPDPTQPTAQPAARPAPKPAAKPAPTAKAKPAPHIAPKAKPAAKPKPRPAAAPAPATEEPQPEDRPTKKEKPAKVKKPKRDKNGNKLPKADPTQPATDEP